MKPIGFDNKLTHSIELLRKGESMALRFYSKGYYLAFSGGKDSQALYHLAKKADVKFGGTLCRYDIRPSELVRFIRTNYPDVIFDRPDLSFWRLCIRKRRKVIYFNVNTGVAEYKTTYYVLLFIPVFWRKERIPKK